MPVYVPTLCRALCQHPLHLHCWESELYLLGIADASVLPVVPTAECALVPSAGGEAEAVALASPHLRLLCVVPGGDVFVCYFLDSCVCTSALNLFFQNNYAENPSHLVLSLILSLYQAAEQAEGRLCLSSG